MFKRPEDVLEQEEIFQRAAEAAASVIENSNASSVLVIAYHWDDARNYPDGKPHKLATVYERLANPCGCNAKTPEEKRACLLRRAEGHIETLAMYADDIQQENEPLSH